AVTCDDDPSYLDHIRGAAENASRDYDSLVAKLSTAGLGVCVGVAGIAKGNSSWLGVAAGMFALAAVAALLAHRLSADRLLRLANRIADVGEQEAYEELENEFSVLDVLNWAAFILLVLGFAS